MLNILSASARLPSLRWIRLPSAFSSVRFHSAALHGAAGVASPRKNWDVAAVACDTHTHTRTTAHRCLEQTSGRVTVSGCVRSVACTVATVRLIFLPHAFPSFPEPLLPPSLSPALCLFFFSLIVALPHIPSLFFFFLPALKGLPWRRPPPRSSSPMST